MVRVLNKIKKHGDESRGKWPDIFTELQAKGLTKVECRTKERSNLINVCIANGWFLQYKYK